MSTSSNRHPAKNQRWGAGLRIDDRKQGAARIIAAARLCFADSSIASTTIEQITRQAGVSRRTFYRYFDGKEAIIQAVVEEQAQPFFEQLYTSVHALPDQGLNSVLTHCVLYAVEHGPQMEGHQLLLGGTNAAATAGFYLRSPRMQQQFFALLQPPFEQAQQDGVIPGAWRLDDLLNWIGRLIQSFIQNPESPEDIERLVRQFLLPPQPVPGTRNHPREL